MRRILLAPPRPPIVARAAVAPPPSLRNRERLEGPAAASERRRRLFHPRRGWFRRFERALSLYLANAVHPRIPGISVPYDRQLRRSLTLSEAEICLAGLAPALDGMRILLITDVHAGPFVSPCVLAETFEKLMRLRPDLVLLGGDLTTSRVEDFLRSSEAFAALHAPLGVYAVFGNHEYYTRQPVRLGEEIEAAGIRVLHNAWAAIERGGSILALAGVDDLILGRPDLDRALDGAPDPVVLLSHNPDLLFEAERRGVALMLSGHTHAGQLRVPGLPVLVRQSRYRLDEGRFRAGSTELVVSRGLGAVGLPWRMACPPEAVLLRIRSPR
jgi:predicted MPP superfamily phosphohydrolase